MDEISTQRLAVCHPELERRIMQLYAMAGVDFRVTQGLRTWQEQANLYAQGRTAHGVIVTNAEPGYSWHNFGLAVDFVPMLLGQPLWETSQPQWKAIISLAPSCGLVSGSTWTHFPDFPHLQPQEIPVTPSDTDRQDFKEAGMGAVWQTYAEKLLSL